MWEGKYIVGKQGGPRREREREDWTAPEETASTPLTGRPRLHRTSAACRPANTGMVVVVGLSGIVAPKSTFQGLFLSTLEDLSSNTTHSYLTNTRTYTNDTIQVATHTHTHTPQLNCSYICTSCLLGFELVWSVDRSVGYLAKVTLETYCRMRGMGMVDMA